jgi:hypothetical protein
MSAYAVCGCQRTMPLAINWTNVSCGPKHLCCRHACSIDAVCCKRNDEYHDSGAQTEIDSAVLVSNLLAAAPKLGRVVALRSSSCTILMLLQWYSQPARLIAGSRSFCSIGTFFRLLVPRKTTFAPQSYYKQKIKAGSRISSCQKGSYIGHWATQQRRH